MDSSVLIARLMAPMMVVMGAGLLFNGTSYRAVASDFLKSTGLIFLAGFTTLLLGLLIVVFHNVWVPGWPVIITIFGWIMVVAGIVRMTWPERLRSLGERMMANNALMTGATILYLVVGIVLGWFGYFA